MNYALSAYLDACQHVARAHCEFSQRSIELCIAACEALAEPLIEPWLAFMPKSSAKRAIGAVSYSAFGDRAVISATFPDHRARG